MTSYYFGQFETPLRPYCVIACVLLPSALVPCVRIAYKCMGKCALLWAISRLAEELLGDQSGVQTGVTACLRVHDSMKECDGMGD